MTHSSHAGSSPARRLWGASLHTVGPLLVGLGWLLLLGAVRYELPPALQAAGMVGVGAAFGWLHLVRGWPASWGAGALGRPQVGRATLVIAPVVGVLFWVGSAAWYVATGGDATELGTWEGGVGGLLAAMVFAPLIEEVVFRGWIQPFWTRAVGGVVGVVLVAGLFALLHTQGPVLTRFVGGLVLGSLAYVSRSIWLGVGLHVSYNSAAMVLPQVLPVVGVAEAASAQPDGVGLYGLALGAFVVGLGVCGLWLRHLSRAAPPLGGTPGLALADTAGVRSEVAGDGYRPL